MDSSQFSDNQLHFDAIERIESKGVTCDTFRVKLYGKLHFLKRLKAEYAHDIRYQEALRKEFETGYRLEHPGLARYISLDEDSILMEYIDGETLTQRLASDPDYFKKRSNTENYIRQLLDAVSYLHAHQVLHLDLKPDNIMFTRVSNQVKIIDLGFCYTDTFPCTTGRTDSFAAPEQLAASHSEFSPQTDIYAIGKIIELLPNHNKYNKVIARCTATKPTDRYASTEELRQALFPKNSFFIIIVLSIMLLLAVICFLLPSSSVQAPDVPPNPTNAIKQAETVNAETVRVDAQTPPAPVTTSVNNPQKPVCQVDIMKTDMRKLVTEAYEATIKTFNDSVFPPPSPTTYQLWETAALEFNNRVMQIAEKLSKNYPEVPSSDIDVEAARYVQDLIGHVFNRMRKNGEKNISEEPKQE